MVGTRQLERVLSHAAEAGAKVVLVGDPQQLQAIEAGAAFRSMSVTAAQKLVRCAASAKSGSATPRAISPLAEPAMHCKLIAPAAWGTRPRPASKREAI